MILVATRFHSGTTQGQKGNAEHEAFHLPLCRAITCAVIGSRGAQLDASLLRDGMETSHRLLGQRTARRSEPATRYACRTMILAAPCGEWLPFSFRLDCR